MSNPSPQVKYLCTNAVKQAHLNVHRALSELTQDGSEKEAKRLIGQAIKHLTQALIEL